VARSTGLRVSSPEFLFRPNIPSLSISEKPPLWKMFSPRIPVYIIGYNASWRSHDPPSQNLGVATLNTPRVDGYGQDVGLCLYSLCPPNCMQIELASTLTKKTITASFVIFRFLQKKSFRPMFFRWLHVFIVRSNSCINSCIIHAFSYALYITSL